MSTKKKAETFSFTGAVSKIERNDATYTVTVRTTDPKGSIGAEVPKAMARDLRVDDRVEITITLDGGKVRSRLVKTGGR